MKYAKSIINYEIIYFNVLYYYYGSVGDIFLQGDRKITQTKFKIEIEQERKSMRDA